MLFSFNNCVNGLPVSLDALTSPILFFYSLFAINLKKLLGHGIKPIVSDALASSPL
jgi:hypothetical protein